MANEIAQRLGYTNREAVSGKHIAMNMSLTNAIRMGLVVNPKLVSCAYSLKTDGSLDELKDRIEQIEDIQERNEKLEEYESLRRKVESAEGIPEILQANVKKGGKYIVFLPLVEDLEDEDGNVIGRKKGKEKLEYWKKQIEEYFKGSEIKPNFHSMLGEYGDKENARRLEEFQNSNTEETEFMLVINKANEGLHIDKLDGIIWLRTMDKNSRILYLQQLGRVIYSEDPDNPTKYEDRPVVIDLVNNTLKVNWENEITEQDDIQMLNLILDWTERHDGTLPNINSTDKEETGYARVLKEIQGKYKEYLKSEFDGLNEKQVEEIKKVISLGSQVDLWQIDLPERVLKQGEKQSKTFGGKTKGPFELTGLLKDFVELEEKVDEIELIGRSLKNALEILKWCEERYGDKEKWERRLPNTKSTDEYEKILGYKLFNLRMKIKKYEEKPIEEIENEVERRIVEIVRNMDEEYAYGLHQSRESLGIALQIEKWCEERYGDKEKWERRLPSRNSTDEYEISLGSKLFNLRKKIKKYEGKPIEEIENEVDRRIVEIIRRIDEEYAYGPHQSRESLGIALQIEKWCEERYGDKEKWERRLPSRNSTDEYEISLSIKLDKLKMRIKEYEGKSIEEIENEVVRRKVKIIRNMDEEYAYGPSQSRESLGIALQIEKWCEERYGDKEKWERRLPSIVSTDEYEKFIGRRLSNLRTRIKKYEGKPVEEIENEVARRIVEIVRNIDEEYAYGPGQSRESLGIALQIKKWCEERYGDKEKWERRLPSRNSTDHYEKMLGEKLARLRTKIKKYEGKSIEEIENEVDRRIVGIVRRIDKEYNPRKLTSQKIVQASISSLTNPEMADKVDAELKTLVEKTKEKGGTRDEQP